VLDERACSLGTELQVLVVTKHRPAVSKGLISNVMEFKINETVPLPNCPWEDLNFRLLVDRLFSPNTTR
jgi:hypothetical protein